MLEELSSAWPIICLDRKQLGEKVFGLCAQSFLNLLRKLIVGSANLVIELFVGGASIRKLSRQNSEEENSESPDVGRWTTIFSFTDNLGCHIRWSTTEYLDLLIVWDTSREPEIDDLDVIIVVQQQIFKLDVSVGDASRMTVFQSLQNLLEYSLGIPLFKPTITL